MVPTKQHYSCQHPRLTHGSGVAPSAEWQPRRSVSQLSTGLQVEPLLHLGFLSLVDDDLNMLTMNGLEKSLIVAYYLRQAAL
jgi:hypothetical protein